MNEEKELMAKALEIAIAITKADHTQLWLDGQENVHIHDPLYTTLRTVIRVINCPDFAGTRMKYKIFRELSRG